MQPRWRRILKWLRWSLLALVLLPFASLILMKMTGSMSMRKPDDQIMGDLHAYPVVKTLDSIEVGNRRIVFLKTSKEEKKKKRAIIFVHGSPGSLDAFIKYMHSEDLLAQSDLITYDRPGFGHSNYGKSLPSLKGQAKVINELMKSQGYDQYWLVGHSYGGAVIIQAALDYQQHIAGLFIIAGSVVYDLEPVSAWRKWLDLPFISILMPNSLKVSNEELMSLRRDLRMIDDDWKEINVPVSILHGTEDMLVPFENLSMARDKLVNADTIRTQIFENENHFILWTQMQQIIKEIHAVLSIHQ